MELSSLGFEASYDAREKATPGVDLSFGRKSTSPEEGELVLHTRDLYHQGLVIEVTTKDGDVWTGSFQPGPGGVSGIFATPCADVLCVIASGQGFWIPTLNPEEYELIRSIPVKWTSRIQMRPVLVFADFVRLSAYGESGFLWQTDDLSWDGLTITDSSSGFIRGFAWDSPAGKEIPFAVDVATGQAVGGSSPKHYRTRTAGN